MIINFDILNKAEISAEELLIMQIIYQKEYKRLERRRDTLLSLWGKGMLTKVKGKKSDAEYLKARLSDKGKRFLDVLQVAEITPTSKKLADYLVSLYKNANLATGNEKEIQKRVAWFLAESQIDPNEVYAVVEDYINTEESKFISRLDNLLWKGSSVFSAKYKLEESKLFQMLNY